MRTFVFLVEERSMGVVLESLLPKILQADVNTIVVPHEGKSDLEKSIPHKLRAWRTPNTHFIVMRDQDLTGCKLVKAHLQDLCARGERPNTLVRIVCRELEAWVLGDLRALSEGSGVEVSHKDRAVRADPDTLHSPSKELERLVPGYGKVGYARRIAPFLDPDNNRSESFNQFVSGLRRLEKDTA